MAPKPTTAARRTALLRDPDVRSWYNDHAKVGTAATQLDQLELFIRRSNLGLEELVELAKESPPKRLKEVVNAYIRSEQSAGRKARYVLNVWWGVRSFLASQGAAPEWNPAVERTENDEEDAGQTVPSHDQLRQIANAVKSGRDRAVVYVLASSGVRIGVLATQFEPADGLRLKHLQDLQLGSELAFSKVPFAIRVPAYLSKGKNAYYTFGSREAADAILSYLKERKQGGERLSPESPLVLPDTRGRRSERRAKDGASFMVRKALAERVKKAMCRVAPPNAAWHAHTLRAWFSTQMEACESKGLVSRTRREFFMGHSLGVDGQYNIERPLSPTKLDELRASYAKCEPNLSSVPGSASRRDSNREAYRVILSAWYSDADIDKIDLDDVATVTDALRKGATKGSTQSDPRQQVIAEAELSRFLADGWLAKMPVNGSKFVVERP
jgi:integrase